MHTESLIEFYCTICGQSLQAPRGYSGNFIGCPTCERAIPVPGFFAEDGEETSLRRAFSPEVLSVEITFLCPSCDNSLMADARCGGEPFICPKCDTTGLVPRWNTQASPPAGPAVHAVAQATTLSPEEIDFLSGAPGEDWTEAKISG